MIINNLNSKQYINKRATVLDSNLFCYTAATKSFSQEISSLPVKSIRELEGRIFDDACDVGFWLKSSKTGRMMLFAPTKPDMTINGDEVEIQGWNFEGTNEKNEKFKLLVIND